MNAEHYLEALLSLPAAYTVHVSPDGTWVAWTWLRTAPTMEVYAAPTDGSAGPVRMTDTPENTLLVGWTRDSRALIVSQDKGGNERDQLFRVFLAEPQVMQPLTEEDPNYFIHGAEMHPNGNWLVYAANVDVQSGEEIEAKAIIRHDVDNGERLELARTMKPAFSLVALSPDGSKVAYGRKDRHPAGRQQWLVGIDGSDDHEIVNVGADKKAYAMSWFSDSRRLLVEAETDTYKRIGVWSAQEGIRWVLDDPARLVDEAFVPYGVDQIVVIEIRDARQSATLLDPDTGQETPFPRLPGTLTPRGVTPNGEWIGVYYSSQQPQDIVRFRMEATTPQELVSLSRVWERTALTPDDLTPAQDFRWTSRDGLPIQGWLYRPQGEARGTVVYVHGGPTAHSEDKINNEIQFFVRQGFNVLDPNYRGSTGFNFTFREKIKEDGWGGMEQVDILTGIEALISQGIAQPGQVGITGTSYGGYSSWHAITHFPLDVLAASAPVCGMTDLVVDYETTRPDLRPYSEEMMGGSPQEAPERYHERSPINFVQDIQGRLLIVQGMRDPNVHPQNVADVRERLDKAGVEYGVLAFDDEGHGIIKPKNQKVLYQELASFFRSAFANE